MCACQYLINNDSTQVIFDSPSNRLEVTENIIFKND